MYRKKILLDCDSDAAALLEQTYAECTAAGLSPQAANTLLAEMRDPLHTLIRSGSAVASSGGKFHASREIDTNAAVITLIARYGERPGLLARLWRRISQRR